MLSFRTWATAKPFSKIQHFIAHDGTPEAKNHSLIKEQIQRQLVTFLEAKLNHMRFNKPNSSVKFVSYWISVLEVTPVHKHS